MAPTDEQHHKTALDRDRVRSQVGAPLAPQVARNPEKQAQPDAPEKPPEETPEAQHDPRARQPAAAAQKQETGASTANALETAAGKIPGAGAVVSGLAKNFPILWLIISFKSKFDAQSAFLQIIIKVLVCLLGPFLWPMLVFASHFTPKLLPKTTNSERATAAFVVIILVIVIAAIALIFLCFSLAGLVTRIVFNTGVTCNI